MDNNQSIPSSTLPRKMPIYTSRLYIRPIDVSDAQAVLAFKRESWPELLKWLIWVHPPSIEERTVDDETLFCSNFSNRVKEGSDLICLAFDRNTDRLIGSGSLHKINQEKSSPSLGFNVRSSETGKGYATEIAVAMCLYAFEVLGAKFVKTFHARGNIGSQRVIEKVGFELQKVLPNQHETLDGFVDECIYNLTGKGKMPDLAINWEEG